jgi:GxxExxY protein
MDTNNSILHKDLSYEIMAAVYEVHNVLGSGFLEKIYENALLEELALRGIDAVSQRELSVSYKGKQVGHYLTDIVVKDQILLELKSVEFLNKAHDAQILNYLKATGFRLGILINFGRDRVESKRFAL